MYRRLSRLSFVFLFSVAAAGHAWADDTAQAPADPTGSWEWEYTSPGGDEMEFALKLAWDGKDLTGRYMAFNSTTDIEEAKLDKDDLSFVVNREFNGTPFTVKFAGKVQEDDINGTVNVDFGNGPQDFDWHARRTLDVEDVLGTWQLRLETPQGVLEPRITFTEDAGKLHGAYSSRFGERDAKNIEIDGNELTWEISSEDGGFKVVYRGKPRGDKISGSNEFDFGGNTGTMEFTGERESPEETAPPQGAAPDSP